MHFFHLLTLLCHPDEGGIFFTFHYKMPRCLGMTSKKVTLVIPTKEGSSF